MTIDGGGGPPSLPPYFGEDGGLHYGERVDLPATPEELVRDFEFQMILAPGLQLAHLDYTEEHKIVVAKEVLNQLKGHSLQLVYDNPRVYLNVQNQKSSTAPGGRKIIEFGCKVMVFTNHGPKHFPYTFSVLDRNTHTLPDSDQPAEVPGAVAVTRSFLDRILRRR